MNDRTSARKKRIFASRDIDGKRVTGPAPQRVTGPEQSYAKFTRILVGYSAALEIIFVPLAAEAQELERLLRVRAVAWKDLAAEV